MFKIGDKIIVIRDFTISGVDFKKGQIGTIKDVRKDVCLEVAGIEWKHYNRHFHNCSGTCKNGYGFFIYANIDLIKVINKKGNMYGF